jgi:tetratricopeptide (TPR) repeat protein
MGRYWRLRAAAPEGMRWLDAALQSVGDQPPAEDEAEAQLARSDLLDLVDDVDGARRAAHRALALYRRAGVQTGIAKALCAVAANGLLGEPNLELVVRAATAAYCHASIVGDEYVMARALAVLAPALPPSRRLAVLEEAEMLLVRLGNRRELAVAYSNTAYRALLEGRCEEALRLAEKAMAVAEACDNPNLTMFTAANLGVAALLSGDFGRARTAFSRQLLLCGRHNFRWQAAEGFAGLAAVAADDGDYERAARLLAAARTVGQLGSKAILQRLESDFIVPARARYGGGGWRDAERMGAAMLFHEAIAYALGEGEPGFGSSTLLERVDDPLVL